MMRNNRKFALFSFARALCFFSRSFLLRAPVLFFLLRASDRETSKKTRAPISADFFTAEMNLLQKKIICIARPIDPKGPFLLAVTESLLTDHKSQQYKFFKNFHWDIVSNDSSFETR
jgi:hypothetical protein